jgi:anti-sigma-K factor RskA
MSDPMNNSGDITPPDMQPDEMLAMDFALGVLDRVARRSAEARLRSDPAFRGLVEGWQAMLAPLDAETEAVLPPGSIWAGVLSEIEPVRRSQQTSANATAAPRGLWYNLSFWRGLGLAGPVLAAVALVTVNPSAPPVLSVPAGEQVSAAPPAQLSTTLAGADGAPLLAATWDPLRGTVVLTPATSRDDPGRDVELWVIEGDKPPRSLGLIKIDTPNAHAISSQVVSGLQPGSVLAISIEPIGGSPTGLPTGPVVATGKLSAV